MIRLFLPRRKLYPPFLQNTTFQDTGERIQFITATMHHVQFSTFACLFACHTSGYNPGKMYARKLRLTLEGQLSVIDQELRNKRDKRTWTESAERPLLPMLSRLKTLLQACISSTQQAIKMSPALVNVMRDGWNTELEQRRLLREQQQRQQDAEQDADWHIGLDQPRQYEDRPLLLPRVRPAQRPLNQGGRGGKAGDVGRGGAHAVRRGQTQGEPYGHGQRRGGGGGEGGRGAAPGGGGSGGNSVGSVAGGSRGGGGDGGIQNMGHGGDFPAGQNMGRGGNDGRDMERGRGRSGGGHPVSDMEANGNGNRGRGNISGRGGRKGGGGSSGGGSWGRQ